MAIKRLKTKRIKSTRGYPVPGAVGGRLIRKLVTSVRAAGVPLPVTSHILCACSGGADSTALALLLLKYGRRVGARITLLHVNHGWRGKESDADERFVRSLALKFKAPVVILKAKEKPSKGDSWEAHARSVRKDFFRKESAKRGGAPVFTAHQADDQAETRLWRLFTGAFESLGEGILNRHEVEIRPLLGIRRSELCAFLREEGQKWRTDSSNFDPRFLRSKMRKDLMPLIESLFPTAIESINSVRLRK